MLALTSLALSIVASALAAPFPASQKSGPGGPGQSFAAPACTDLSNVTLTVPTGLATPTGTPKFVGLGVGTQNYTCASTGTYTSAGALATLYDVACMVDTPVFDTLAATAYNVWTSASTPDAVCKNSRVNAPAVLGEHYFVVNPVTGSGLSPEWDFGSKGFVIAAKTGDVVAANSATDVDLLSLSSVQGSLATQIYRLDTHGGQPPASCTPNETTTVKYTAMYWLF